MRIPFPIPIPTAPFPNTYPKLKGIQKSTRIQNCNTHLVSRGSSDLNPSPISNYASDVSSRNSDLNSPLIFNYALDVSRGNSDLNSSSIFNYAFDVSLRVDFTNTFLYKALYRSVYNTYNTYEWKLRNCFVV